MPQTGSSESYSYRFKAWQTDDIKGRRMNLNEFMRYVELLMRDWPEWRYGQTVSNALSHVDPELERQINGSIELDPYYNSNNVPALYEWLVNEGGMSPS